MPRHKPGSIDPAIAESVRLAAQAEAAIPEEEKPDFVDIDGVRYYRKKPVAVNYDPMKPAGTKTGFSRIVINIAPHAPNIRLDNVIYYAGMEYEIADDRIPTFLEIMARTWDHERSTGGAMTNMAGAKNTVYNLRSQGSFTRLGPPGVSG